jgi:hypothetical protein
VVVKPILDEESHSVTFKGFDIFEILGKPKENSGYLEFSVKNIDNGKKETVAFNRRYPNIRDLSENTMYNLIDNNYIVAIKYVVSLADEYFQTVRNFLDVAADKKDKGVSLSSYKDYKNANYIMLSKLSHIAKRGIVTRLYQFRDRKWKKINIMENMNLEPYMEFSILDEDELPIKKWRHNFNNLRYGGECKSGEDYTLECAHYNRWLNQISNKKPRYFNCLMRINGWGKLYRREVYVWGIVSGGNPGRPFKFVQKSTSAIAFLKNDGIEYITYILLKKEDVKLIKDVQISIHPNPVKK